MAQKDLFLKFTLFGLWAPNCKITKSPSETIIVLYKYCIISGEECAAQAGDAVPVILDGGRGHEVLRCQRQEARRGSTGMMID